VSNLASRLPSLTDSIAAYEAGMIRAFGDTLIVSDLDAKHDKMRESPFLFLRATCWRWAEAAASLCPELMDAPPVPSVGDAHADNFGLWRDAQARLVWGVNDFDEAAILPWCLDLVRLCTSLSLAGPQVRLEVIAAALLQGYARGLEKPRSHVLELKHLWLRDACAASDTKREKFWADLLGARAAAAVPSPMRAALVAELPDSVTETKIAARQAGAGSLGRPRYVASGQWRGGPIAVEAKGRMPSCWGGSDLALAVSMFAGRYRSPDPSVRFESSQVLRRLAPNDRKIEFGEIGASLRAKVIVAMGRDLAAIHGEDDAGRAAITADLARRGIRWLARAAATVTEWTVEEHFAYRGA
jgi:Uncharacterized protein conserved in bacteria (DUF2252)